MEAPDMDVIKEIPGYKVILKAVLKAQIQQLVEQLATTTAEQSIILTASVVDGTLSHIGSDLAKGFLEEHEDVKSQFLGFCLKRQHEKQRDEEERKRQEMVKSMHQLSSPPPHTYGHSNNPRGWPRGPGPGYPAQGGPRSRGIRHEPYPQMNLARVTAASAPTTPVKMEPSDTSNDSFGDSNNMNKSRSRSASHDDNQSNSVQSNPGGSESDNEQNETDPHVKVEATSESDLELEITGVEPGRPVRSQSWDLSTSGNMQFDPSMGAMGTGGDQQPGQIAERKCPECGKIFSTRYN